jgi:hypothetical protein
MEVLLQRDQEERAAMRLRLEVQDEAAQTSTCDGSDAKETQQYIRRVNRVPEDLRLAVLRKTAQGDLREELERFLQEQGENGAPTWHNTRAFLLQTFVSTDIQEACRTELEAMRQDKNESIMAFNRRFRSAASEAYPQEDRTEETHRLLMKVYGRALASDKMAKIMLRNGWPATIQAAMTLTADAETRDVSIAHLGRKEEAMEIDAFQRQRQPQPPVEQQRTQSFLAKLEAKIDRLGDDLKRVQREQRNIRPTRDASRRGETRRCYGCGQVGHLAKHCPNPSQRRGRGVPVAPVQDEAAASNLNF